MKKNVCLCSYMDSFEWFNETKLLSKKNFNNPYQQSENRRIQTVSGILLNQKVEENILFICRIRYFVILGDVSENFRKIGEEYFNLELCHNISA